MLQVDDYQELLALNRALMETRYLARDVDGATRGSGFLSKLHQRVVDEIKAKVEASGGEGEVAKWEKWQDLAARMIERPRIIEYLSEGWKRLPSHEIKRDVLINQIRPFKFTEDDVDRLMSELDRRSSE